MIETGVLVTLALLCIAINLLNSICIYVIFKTPRLRKHSILAIANLLCCHLLQGLVVIPSYIVKRMKLSDVTISRQACDAFRFSYMTTNYVAVISLLLITIDRLCAIKWPMFYKNSVTNTKMIAAIVSVWLYVLALCVLPFFPVSVSSKCTYRPTKEWSITMLTINTFLPMLLIFACYAVIFFTARSSSNKSSTENQITLALRIAKISIAVVSAFTICWGPSFFYYMLSLTCPQCFSSSFKDSEIENVLNFVMKVLTFVDGLLAPLIYCLMHRGIRDGILQTEIVQHARRGLNFLWDGCRSSEHREGGNDKSFIEKTQM